MFFQVYCCALLRHVLLYAEYTVTRCKQHNFASCKGTNLYVQKNNQFHTCTVTHITMLKSNTVDLHVNVHYVTTYVRQSTKKIQGDY